MTGTRTTSWTTELHGQRYEVDRDGEIYAVGPGGTRSVVEKPRLREAVRWEIALDLADRTGRPLGRAERIATATTLVGAVALAWAWPALHVPLAAILGALAGYTTAVGSGGVQ